LRIERALQVVEFGGTGFWDADWESANTAAFSRIF
jgi:hypothetical protein